MPAESVILCGNCQVRPWLQEDLYSLVRHINNRKIWLNLRNRLPYPYTESDGMAWLDAATAQEPVTDFAIEQQGYAVGGIGLILKDDVDFGTAEVGYWLSETLWDQGIMTAVLKSFVPWAFANFELRRIFALPFADNRASCRALEKAGFQLEGILRQQVLKDGKVKDQAVYGILRTT